MYTFPPPMGTQIILVKLEGMPILSGESMTFITNYILPSCTFSILPEALKNVYPSSNVCRCYMRQLFDMYASSSTVCKTYPC